MNFINSQELRNKENQTRNQIILNIYAKKFESERCLKSIFLFGIFPTFFLGTTLSCHVNLYSTYKGNQFFYESRYR